MIYYDLLQILLSSRLINLQQFFQSIACKNVASIQDRIRVFDSDCVCFLCLGRCVSTFVFCEYACSDIVMWRLPHTLPSRQRVKPRPSPVAWSFLHTDNFYILVIPTPSTCLHLPHVKKCFLCYMFIMTTSRSIVNTSILRAKLLRLKLNPKKSSAILLSFEYCLYIVDVEI